MSIVWPTKTTAEKLDYQVDWADRLAGDTIATSGFTLDTQAGLTKTDDSTEGATATTWLEGGTGGLVGKLTNTITTAGGRSMVEEISLPIDILVVEDGSGIADAESYASLDQADAYCARKGIAWVGSTADKHAALRRGTAWIDDTYRSRYPGCRVKGRGQGLEWPRDHARDGGGNIIEADEIPVELINATIEASARELAEPNSLAPDLDRGGQIKTIKAGSVEIDYGGTASPNTTFQAIDNVLSGLLGPTPSPYSMRAARG